MKNSKKFPKKKRSPNYSPNFVIIFCNKEIQKNHICNFFCYN